MAELLITSSLNRIEEDEVLDALPPHVTIWQPFQLPSAYEELFIDDATEVIAGFSPLEIIGGEVAQFGPRNDILVRRVIALGSGATLLTLHTMLGRVIEWHEGVVPNPEWTYERYSPHVTQGKGRALDYGEHRHLNTVELIERNPLSRRKIVKKVWELEPL